MAKAAVSTGSPEKESALKKAFSSEKSLPVAPRMVPSYRAEHSLMENAADNIPLNLRLLFLLP